MSQWLDIHPLDGGIIIDLPLAAEPQPMSIFRDATQILRGEGVKSLAARSTNWVGMRILERLNQPSEGVAVMEEDWDNLILLDACRYDEFARMSTLSGQLERRVSLGEVTWNFLRNNFEGRECYDTVYIAGNAVVGANADRLNLYKLIRLWDENADSSENGAIVRPEKVVKEALAAHDTHPNKRLIAHFLQPHTPFLRKDGKELSPSSPYRDFDAARRGEVAQAEIIDVYRENLSYVLKHVQRLVDQLDGRTVVTADHGELLGEGVSTVTTLLHPRWPFRDRRNFAYGHYSHVRAPELINIPWLTIEGEERRTITAADGPAEASEAKGDLSEHLRALGYKA